MQTESSGNPTAINNSGIVVGSNNPARNRGGFVSGTGCALVGLIATTTLYATNSAERGCALVAGGAAFWPRPDG